MNFVKKHCFACSMTLWMNMTLHNEKCFTISQQKVHMVINHPVE